MQSCCLPPGIASKVPAMSLECINPKGLDVQTKPTLTSLKSNLGIRRLPFWFKGVDQGTQTLKQRGILRVLVDLE